MKILLKQIFSEFPIKIAKINAPAGRCVYVENYDGRKTLEQIFDYSVDSLKILNPNEDIVKFYNENGWFAVFSKRDDNYEPIGLFYPRLYVDIYNSYEWKRTDSLLKELTNKIQNLQK